MRIRPYPAVAFAIILSLSGYAALAGPAIPTYNHSDKALHFLSLFLLTTCFYWIVDSTRRRNLQLTILVCSGGIGIGAELVQAVIRPTGVSLILANILANLIGSGTAVGLCVWYHRRMIERRRLARVYQTLPDLDQDGQIRDVELAGIESDHIENEPTRSGLAQPSSDDPKKNQLP